MNEKLILGTFISFAETGTTIDSTTVGPAAFPDDEPTTNWASIGCVLESDWETEKETDTDYCPNAAGGYSKTEDEQTVRDIIKFKVRESSELFMRMMLGFPAIIVDDAAQVPFTETRRFIEGWIKVQGVGEDGDDRVVMKVYGKLKLDENPKWSKDPTKPGYKFEVAANAIATAIPSNIIA